MKTITIAILIILLVACSNRQSNSNQYYESKNDSLLLAHRNDSVNRERIFESKGDTIFAGVLYGMNKIEAEKSIKSFEQALKHYDANIKGFDFGSIHFMNISLYDYEDFKPSCPDPYENSYLWKGKLSSVEWHSYNLEAQKLNEIENVLNKLIHFFESRYGKPNFKIIQSRNWFVFNDGNYQFFDYNIAKWETKKRLITIGIEWDKWPKTYTEIKEGLGYKYNIDVRFSDKEKISEIVEYRDSINKVIDREGKERRREDSLKYINSL